MRQPGWKNTALLCSMQKEVNYSILAALWFLFDQWHKLFALLTGKWIAEGNQNLQNGGYPKFCYL